MKLPRTLSLLAVVLLGGVLLRAQVPDGGFPKHDPKSTAALKMANLVATKRIDFPGFADPKTTLTAAIDALQKLYGVDFTVNDRAFKFEGQ